VRNRRWRGMAAALVVMGSTLVVSACGSSGSGSSTATGSAAAAAGGSTSGGGTASSLLPASIRQRGYINVAGPDASPPLSEAGKPDPQGMDPDIAAALGKVLGVQVHYSAVPFDAELTGLAAGKYDMAGGEFYVTAARIKEADFISAWHDYSAFLSLKSSSFSPTESTTSLCGQHIGVMSGSAEEAALTALNGKCSSKMSLSSFPQENAAFLALSSSRVAAVTTGREQLELASEASAGKFKITGEFGGGPTAWAVARNGDSAQILKALDFAFKRIMANGTYMQILKKWHTEYGAVQTPTIYVKGSKLPNYGE
jgi:polar amino acid transport system substrate-binding protein